MRGWGTALRLLLAAAGASAAGGTAAGLLALPMAAVMVGDPATLSVMAPVALMMSPVTALVGGSVGLMMTPLVLATGAPLWLLAARRPAFAHWSAWLVVGLALPLLLAARGWSIGYVPSQENTLWLIAFSIGSVVAAATYRLLMLHVLNSPRATSA